jgi:DNA-binding CsgD family transcriptional regulator
MIGLGRAAVGRGANNLTSTNRKPGLDSKLSARLREQLTELVRATGSSGGLVGRHDYHTGASSLIASVGMPDCAYLRAAGFEVPWLRFRQYFQAAGLVWRGGDMMGRAQLHRTAFYRHVMEPIRADGTLHATIAVHGTRLDHVLLMHPSRADDYTADDIEVCRDYVSGGEWVEAGLFSVFEDRGIGVAIVDAAAEVLAATRTFEEFVSRLNDAPAASSRRSAGRGGPVVLPPAIVNKLVEGGCPSTHVLQAKQGEARFACDFRLIAPKRARRLAPAPLIAIVVSDLDATPHLDEAVLRSAFGLSPAEARVSALVGRGDRLEDAASVLGVRPNTVRTHLKRIFEKTATHRQAELVKVLLTVARRNSV